MQFSFSRKIYKFGILWPYAQLFSKVHQRWIHMTEWIIPLNCFYEFIIKCNKNYPSNCPKVTYCMSILFLYTQAICHLVAIVLICKIIRSKKGRTEKENDFDWVTHLLTRVPGPRLCWLALSSATGLLLHLCRLLNWSLPCVV